MQALIVLCLTVLLLNPVISQRTVSQSENREAILLRLSDAITPATMDYVQRGIARAQNSSAELLILELDTPGGLMASTRGLIKSILASTVPVVTYVSPSGSRAASAGTYILLASHVAAMAPATHIGSATPVQIGAPPLLPGSDPDPAKRGPTPPGDPADANGVAPEPGSAPETAMERKIMEDAVSYIRELAERHGRNADWAERAVREAANLGAREALETGVVDVLAADIDDLLAQLDGRTVQLNTATRTLYTDDLALLRIDPGWRTKLLSAISNPNIAYLLLLLGFYGIVFELSNPGGLVPGVIGATCLLLALFAFQVLTVNYAGLALIVLGLAFIVAEAFVPSFGILGIGGLASFVTGSIILMDGSHQAVSLPAIGGIAAIAAAFLLWAVTRLVGLRRRTPVAGVELMAGESVLAEEAFAARAGAYRGHVRLAGERWHALSDEPVQEGATLRIVAVDGLTLRVEAVTDRGTDDTRRTL